VKRYTSSAAWTSGVLYRCFDAAGDLLYIGATYNTRQRFRRHRQSTPWWSEVASTTEESFEFRWQAMAAERAAIVAERPRYNRRRYYVDLDAILTSVEPKTAGDAA
jgi:excinuclease UvrABC nuclease subunit